MLQPLYLKILGLCAYSHFVGFLWWTRGVVALKFSTCRSFFFLKTFIVFFAGEPFVDGEVVPYDEKYHADWLRDQTDEDAKSGVVKKKHRRKRKKKLI
jgi:hypothetical protein